jgi:hypothetical protein
MPNAICPTCKFEFTPAKPGRVECPQCFESFSPTTPPKPVPKPAKPVKPEDAPIPLAEMVDDAAPVAKPTARPVAKPVAPTPAPKPAPEVRKTVGAPRVRRKRDDDDDEPKRAESSGRKMIALGVVGLLAVVGAAIGGVYALRDGNKPVAAVPPPPPSGAARFEQPPPEPPPFIPPQPPIQPLPPVFNPQPPVVPQPPPEPPKPPPVVPVSPTEVVEITPTAATHGATVELPSAFDRVCVGGGGRFLILRLPAAKQFAVFDATLGKVATYLPMPEDGTHAAAGMTKLFLVLPKSGTIQRWNLLNFEKELTVANPVGGRTIGALMGHLTDGPLFLVGPSQFIDTATMKSLGMPARGTGGWRTMGEPGYPESNPPSIRVSADGRVYAWWSVSTSPTGLSTLTLADGGAAAGYEHTTVGAITPGPDGTLFTVVGLYTPDLKPMGGKTGHNPYRAPSPVPAVHGPFYLSPVAVDDGFPRGPGSASPPSLSLRMLGHDGPLLTLPKVAGLTMRTPQAGETQTPLADRLYLIPDAKLLVVTSEDRRTLHLNAFDPKGKMDESGIDYLVVMSRPHPAALGKPYRYAPDVWSKRGGVKLKLGAAPDGMKVVGNSLTWKVPADFTGTVDVNLTVTDATGLEVPHNFKLPVLEKAPEPPARPPTPVGVAVKDPPPPEAIEKAAPPKPRTPPKLTSATKELQLPGAFDAVCAAGGGHILLLRLPSTKQIAVFDAREAAVVKYLPLAEADAMVAGGRDHAFVFAPAAGAIQRWNLTTFEKELTVPTPVTYKVERFLHGANSTGPLFLGGGSRVSLNVTALDPRTMKDTGRKFEMREASSGLSKESVVRVSADGRLLTAYGPRYSPMGHTAYRTTGGDYTAERFAGHGDISGHVTPSADGKNVFTSHGVFTAEGKHALTAGEDGRGGGILYTLPAAEPLPVFLSIKLGKGPKLSLHLPNERVPAVELEQVKLPSKIDPMDTEPINTDQRVHLIPSADAVVVLPETNDRVVMYRVNLKEALDRSGKNYLFVTSSPHAAVRGKTFRYAPEVQSKKGGVKVKLDAGPTGMRAVGNAVVWAVPAGFGDKSASVILTVSDATGQETFHTFDLPVADTGAGDDATPPPEPDQAVTDAPPAKALPLGMGKPLWKGPTASIPLPAKATDMCVAGGGRFLLIQTDAGKAIEVVDVSVGAMVKSIPLPEPKVLAVGGATTALLYFPVAKQVHLWDLATMTRARVAPAPAELAAFDPEAFVAPSGADGPVFFSQSRAQATYALDVKTLAVSKVPWKRLVGQVGVWAPSHLEVSADGKVLHATGGGSWGHAIAAVRDGNAETVRNVAVKEPGVGGPLTADGATLLATAGAFATTLDGKAENGGEGRLFPAVEAGYYFLVGAKGGATLFGPGGKKVCDLDIPEATAAKPPAVEIRTRGMPVASRLPRARWQLSVEAGVLAGVPEDGDRVILRRVEVGK